MSHAPQVLLVSNRGPVSFVTTEDGFDTKRGAGGLAGALDPVARRLGDDALWIAAATSHADRQAVASRAHDRLASELGYRIEMLDIDPETYGRYYDVVSNRMLWFAHHCLWDEIGIERFGENELAAWKEAYEPVNRRFAEAARDCSDASGLVLFQDYHLSTASEHLRRLRPSQPISHFTHSSFCGPDGLDRLPDPLPRRIVEGMLGADLVGFHVSRWVEGFLGACAEIGHDVDRSLGVVRGDERSSFVRSYPIPIDAAQLRDRAAGEKARKWFERFDRERSAGKRLIVRADRTEPSKNILRGFEAFGALLDRRLDLRDDVRFVACLYPSRQSMPEYETYSRRIEATVASVNERHPDSIELYMEDDFDRTLGALTAYDVLLVNPLMDGMNLVAKEGPAINETWGTLVLSRGAGAFEELGAYAIEVSDPRDVPGTAAALERALELPLHDRRRRALRLRHIAEAVAPDDWIDAQISDLRAIARGDEPVLRAGGGSR